MKKVVIAVSAALKDAGTARCEDLAAAMHAAGMDVDLVKLGYDVASAGALAGFAADAVIAITADASDIVTFGAMRAAIVWDMSFVSADVVAFAVAEDTARADLMTAVATARVFIGVAKDVRDAIEDHLLVGITGSDIHRAFAYLRAPTAVIIGAGLGNMVYGSSMVRAVAEYLGAPVDLVIHDRFAEGVALFSEAAWVNAVYSGTECLCGRNYANLVSSVTAGPLRPTFTADKTVWLNRLHHYNEEGRFIPEFDLYFLGLQEFFGDSFPDRTPPRPFIRNTIYQPPGNRIVGVAAGAKGGAWSKREWPHVADLVAALKEAGWTVRSFGTPAEYVDGADNMTGIPMRSVIARLEECDVFIGHDGGLCHIAEGIGIPTVAIYGPTGSVKNGMIYDISRNVRSTRGCSPCLYKIDWLRCEQPMCINEISVSEVLAALDSVQTQLSEQGYRLQPATVGEDHLMHEVTAIDRPSVETQRPRYVAERTSAYPDSPLFYCRLVVLQMMEGDMFGAEATASFARNRWRENSALALLCAIARQMVTISPHAYLDLPSSEALLSDHHAVVQAFAAIGLELSARRFVMEVGLRHYLRTGGADRAIQFLAEICRSPQMSSGITRIAARYLDYLSSERAATGGVSVGAMAAISFDDDKAHARMGRVQALGVENLLAVAGETFAAEIGGSAADLISARFVPALANADASLFENVQIAFSGQVDIAFKPFEAVAIVVPHIQVKQPFPGSTSTLLLRHIEGLAATGLRPIVVTVGYDDIPEGILFRNNATYVQAHPRWSKDEWRKLFDAFGVSKAICYGNVDRIADLPSDALRETLRVSLRGLCDSDGLLSSFDANNRWDLLDQTPQPDLSANEITGWLAQELPPLEAVSPAEMGDIIVLIPDARDVESFVHLARATPEIHYTVYSNIVSRGIEKNIHWSDLGPRDLRQLTGALLIQYSTRHAELSGEAVDQLEEGGLCVAASDVSGVKLYAGRVLEVADPAKVGSWRRQIRAAVASLGELHLAGTGYRRLQ